MRHRQIYKSELGVRSKCGQEEDFSWSNWGRGWWRGLAWPAHNWIRHTHPVATESGQLLQVDRIRLESGWSSFQFRLQGSGRLLRLMGECGFWEKTVFAWEEELYPFLTWVIAPVSRGVITPSQSGLWDSVFRGSQSGNSFEYFYGLLQGML